MSSSSTTGSSGDFDLCNHVAHGTSALLTWLASLYAVRNDTVSRTMAMSRMPMATGRFSTS